MNTITQVSVLSTELYGSYFTIFEFDGHFGYEVDQDRIYAWGLTSGGQILPLTHNGGGTLEPAYWFDFDGETNQYTEKIDVFFDELSDRLMTASEREEMEKRVSRMVERREQYAAAKLKG